MMKIKNLVKGLLSLISFLGIIIAVKVEAATITYHTGNIAYSVVCDDVVTEYTGVGTITITDGTKTITILDRNVGASKTGYSTYFQGGRTTPEGVRGCYFRWGNNSGLRMNGDPVHSDSSQLSGKFNGLQTSDLWSGGQQGPCPYGFHIPTSGEWRELADLAGGTTMNVQALRLPKIGNIKKSTDGKTIGFDSYLTHMIYWTSTPINSDQVRRINDQVDYPYLATGDIARFASPIRCIYNHQSSYIECVGDTHMDPVTLECEANVKTGDCALGMPEGHWISKEVTFTRSGAIQQYEFEHCEAYSTYSCN